MSSALALAVLSCGLSTSALQLGVRPCRPIPSVRARVVLQSDFERAQQRKAALIGAEEEVAEEEGIDATSPDYEPPSIDFAGLPRGRRPCIRAELRLLALTAHFIVTTRGRISTKLEGLQTSS